MNTSRGLLMLIGISSGTGLVLINILLIACCLHKRHKKNLKGGKAIPLWETENHCTTKASSSFCSTWCAEHVAFSFFPRIDFFPTLLNYWLLRVCILNNFITYAFFFLLHF